MSVNIEPKPGFVLIETPMPNGETHYRQVPDSPPVVSPIAAVLAGGASLALIIFLLA